MLYYSPCNKTNGGTPVRSCTYLNTDREIPYLGFGVYKLEDGLEAESSVSFAIKNGYRLVDTAPVYKNEESVGRGISRSGVSRKDLFITSKVWNTAQRIGDVEGAFRRSLDRLKLDYFDLYLIHWPVPGCYLSTWKVLEELMYSGRALSIGVSNFDIHHLEEIKRISNVTPAVNQIECHPLCYPKELIDYCQANGILVQAYAPLARGAYFDNDIMCVLGVKYGKTPAQIGLRWAVQKGISVIPKSSSPEHIATNADIFNFEIQDEDMAILDTMNEDLHTSHVPEDLRGIKF
ncbi:MAG: aldo/keto reductase [Blautia sp.]|nr:aldo/keto reductase [Blautia sp.]